MNDDLDLMQLARSGDLLTTVDDTDYRRVSVVFAWPRDGVPTVYCRAEDWSHRPAARLAAKDREIAEMGETLERWAAETLAQTQRASAAEARVKELEQQLAEMAETPVQSQATQFEKQAAYIGGSADVGPCPDYGKEDWKSARSLQMHRQRAHQGMQTFKVPPPHILEALELPETPWRCATCHESTHARSLANPLLCIKCVVAVTDAHLSNGVIA